MAKEKQRKIDVDLEDGKKVTVIVKRPSGSIVSRAGRIAAKVWTECLSDGIMTKKELKEFMKKRKIWDEDKDDEEEKLGQEIADLEKSLAFGSGKGARVKSTEGRDIAIKIREKRFELRELIAERLSLENNTAESLSDNARFDFMVANCTYYENGEKVYSSLEDYDAKSDEEIAFSAASAMAQMLYSLDQDFEDSLPENTFLRKHHFVNDKGALVNDDGVTVDLEGRRINELGQYLDADGNRIDKDGNKLDEHGRYVTTVDYVDEPKKKKTTARKKTKTDG